jgi:uncharacterized protein (DUF305 family)
MIRFNPTRSARPTIALATCFLLAACASNSGIDSPEPAPSDAPSARTSAPAATVVQPGAPGEASRVVTVESIAGRERPSWTEADAEFMAGMIHHHAQALQMTALIPGRSASSSVYQMGLRMEISQRDEIRLMQDWLDERDLAYPDVVLEDGPMQGTIGHDMGATGHDMGAMGGAMDGGLMAMPGMLTPDQMEALRTAEADAFDRLFLEYMIQHHTGALVMVGELFDTPGAGQDSKVFQFATDVDADQRAEMDRMRMLLAQYR